MTWTGFTGAPGVSTFYFLDAVAQRDSLATFLAQVKGYTPGSVTLQIEPSGETIESTTGAITGTWTGPATTPITGGSAGAYAGPVGFQIEWLTQSYLSGRRLRGRTFVVPMATSYANLAGEFDATALGALNGQVTAFLAVLPGNLKIWQRPREATPVWTDVQGRTHAAVAARSGGFGTVDSGFVPKKLVVLRSRRD